MLKVMCKVRKKMKGITRIIVIATNLIKMIAIATNLIKMIAIATYLIKMIAIATNLPSVALTGVDGTVTIAEGVIITMTTEVTMAIEITMTTEREVGTVVPETELMITTGTKETLKTRDETQVTIKTNIMKVLTSRGTKDKILGPTTGEGG